MDREEFRSLYAYNDWANDRLIAMLYRAFGEETDLRLAEDARVRAVQETAVHLIAAQAIWRARWEGHSPTSMLDPAEYPTPLALRMAFGAERARFWGFFETLENDAALLRVVHTKTRQGEPCIYPLWQMMQHVITHAMYHRGQITARLLDLGFAEAVVLTDLIAFYAEQGGEHATPDRPRPS